MVQWLGLQAFTAKDLSSIPGPVNSPTSHVVHTVSVYVCIFLTPPPNTHTCGFFPSKVYKTVGGQTGFSSSLEGFILLCTHTFLLP